MELLAAIRALEALKHPSAVDGLAVRPPCRSSHLCAKAVEAAEAHCRSAGCSIMTMSTGENRTELIPYYEKMGYRVTAVEPSTNPAFKYPIRVVKMEKPL
jgi:ribosomal protein S18 acetylase RimI-like enzyme